MNKLMSFQDVADETGLPLSTIYYLRKKGKGPRAALLGRHLRVKREDFEEWFSQGVADEEERQKGYKER